MTESVLVTGAYGLLGSRLVDALVRRGVHTTVLKRDATVASALELEGTERRVNVVHGDICDRLLLERSLSEYEVDTVFHLAAQTIVGVANRSPLSTFETNIRGTWMVLEACRRAGVGHVLVAASDKAYGSHAQLPYREESSLRPVHPYDVSKAATDLIARSYWHSFNLPVAVTRCSNLYGGGDLNRSRLVPESVMSVLEGRRPVIRSSGRLERDFLYVVDAVDAYLAIWDLLRAGQGAGQAFNAGNDHPCSVLEVVGLICEVAGVHFDPDIRADGVSPGEIERQWVDSTKLRTLSGWAPRTTLNDGLTQTVDWYRRYFDAIRA